MHLPAQLPIESSTTYAGLSRYRYWSVSNGPVLQLTLTERNIDSVVVKLVNPCPFERQTLFMSLQVSLQLFPGFPRTYFVSERQNAGVTKLIVDCYKKKEQILKLQPKFWESQPNTTRTNCRRGKSDIIRSYQLAA